MKKYSLLLLFSFFGSFLFAQSEVLVDKDLPGEYLDVATKIDKGFEPTSNFIQSIVFFSLKVKNHQYFETLKNTGSFAYYEKVNSEKEYFTAKAGGKKGMIVNEEGEAYYLQVDSAAYAKAEAAGKKVLKIENTKTVYSDKSVFAVQTDLCDKSKISISYKDAQSCLVSYTENKDGKTYNVSKVVKFGAEEKIKGSNFKVSIAGNADYNENIPVHVFTAGKISLPFVLIVLLFGALFCTIYFRFPNIRHIRLAYDSVRGKYYDPTGANIVKKEEDEPNTIKSEGTQGEVSPFQALSAALSATVGLGNIAGVAIAITVGGPGATFWLIIAGFLGMASKFAECTLGVKYREIGEDGTVHGGPMYYLKNGFKEKGMAGFGKFLAIFFAIMCVGGSFGGGNMFQVNQAAAQVSAVLGLSGGLPNFIFGVITAILVAIVIIGGIKRIGAVAEAIVPFMAILYIGAGLIIIGVNITALPHTFSLIFTNAFTPSAAVGGFIGAMIAGFQRAAFSNEAGVGSAAIAHSAVRTAYPASEGIVALLEPFIDTVIICTMSALVIIITGSHEMGGSDGVAITSAAFSSVLPGFEYILTLAVILFALSTMLSWSYYGLQAWKFLFGKGKIADFIYKLLFCIFIVVGASAGLGSVVGFSDAMIFAMVFPNIIGVLFLAPVITKEVAKYVNDIKNGTIKAVKK